VDEQNLFQQEPFASSFQPEIFPPWENPNLPAFERWLKTIKAVVIDPSNFFSQMNTSGGIGSPLIFGILGSSIGAMISALVNLFSNHQAFSQAIAQAQERNEGLPVMIGTFVGATCSVIGMPLVIAVCMLIVSAITHLLLMLVNGARRNYDTTFRVSAYLTGSLGLFLVIPYCGKPIFFIWFIVAEIIGLTKAHEISTGKAAFAVLLPTILLCTCAAIIIATFVGLGAFAVAARDGAFN